MVPLKIEVTEEDSLKIIWKDDSVTIISLLELRKMCPCAICSANEKKHSHSHSIYRENQLIIENVSIVGSYALAVAWKDGHNTGIYEFQFLKNISAKEV